LLGIFVFETQSVESKTPLTPTITISIHPNGTRDTTFIYTK
jgi:hypothetical protein